MRARVQQVFALEPEARAANFFAEAFGEIERRRASRVIVQQASQFGLECGVVARFQICLFQLFHRRHQHFRYEPAAVWSEVAACVGLQRHDCSAFRADSSAHRAVRTNSSIFLWSFFPGELSMREQASTPHGWAMATASATFEASRPPARIILRKTGREACPTDQSKLMPAPP